jgi:hypothetical protein
MKTEEDEAFDELAKRQGMWGGGFHAKRAAAADKQREWVGLTAQEAADCWTTSATQTWKNFEAKLKEKNNG